MSSTLALQPEIHSVITYIAEGKYTKASQTLDQLLSAQPEDAVATYLRGIIQSHQGDGAGASQYYQRAESHPNFHESCYALANKAQESGHIMLALSMYEHMLKTLPAHKKLYRMATQCMESLRKNQDQYANEGYDLYGKGQYEQAIACFRKALAFQPDRVELLYVLGLTLYNLRRYEEAEQMLLKACSLQPNHMDSINVLGCVYHMRQEYDKAVEYYRKALELQPDYSIALGNVGCVLADAKRYNEAIKAYENALRVYPDSIHYLMELVQWKRRTCNWTGLKEYEDRLIERIMVHKECATPFNIGGYFPDPNVQLQNAIQWSALYYPNSVTYNTTRPLPATVREDKRLRIGYISGDFNDHAMSYLISELFEQYDREQFEIRAYSTGNIDNSPSGTRMRSAFEFFNDMTVLNSEQGAQKIRDDGIDVLVDMSGYSNKHRMDILALHPAPVQIHYLGCPSPSGAPFIDYYFTDHITSPEGYDRWFTEKLIRLPDCYLINDRKRYLPVTTDSRSAHGLPEDAFVFCAFNGEFKNTPHVFNIWMNILKKVKDSVLWIYSPTPETQFNLKAEAEARGVNPSRIIIATGTSNAPHLTRMRCADLFLDTFPYNGHTTVSDSLWVGVPAITVAGECFCSRVAKSLLYAAELPELCATNWENYEALAVELARDSKRLKRLKAHLEERRFQFPVFDSLKNTRAMEAAYKHAAELYKAGKPPQAFDVTKDFRMVLRTEAKMTL